MQGGLLCEGRLKVFWGLGVRYEKNRFYKEFDIHPESNQSSAVVEGYQVWCHQRGKRILPDMFLTVGY